MQSVELVGTDLFGLGYGLFDKELDEIANRIYLFDAPTTDDLEQEIVEEMSVLVPEDRVKLARKLMDLGVHTGLVKDALRRSGAKLSFWDDPEKRKVSIAVWSVFGTASMLASAYHGYARNQSIGWALWWGLMGSMFPGVPVAIGLAQCKTGPEKRFMLGCRK